MVSELAHDEEPEPLPRWTVLRAVRFTGPVHAVLPATAWLPTPWFTATFFLLHVAGLLALAISYPWWRGRAGELVALVVANHAITFGILGAAVAWR